MFFVYLQAIDEYRIEEGSPPLTSKQKEFVTDKLSRIRVDTKMDYWGIYLPVAAALAGCWNPEKLVFEILREGKIEVLDKAHAIKGLKSAKGISTVQINYILSVIDPDGKLV